MLTREKKPVHSRRALTGSCLSLSVLGVLARLVSRLNRAFAGVEHASSSPAPPPPDPVPHCKKCALFRQCVGRDLAHPIWELPRLTGKRFFEVAQYGLEIAGVPDHVELTKAQQRVKQCVVASEPLVDDPPACGACARRDEHEQHADGAAHPL